MKKTHCDKLEKMYLIANVNTQIYDSTICDFTCEKAVISLCISEKYFHALGAIHGSVYFKMLDDAAFFAVNSIVSDVFVLTTEFSIKLLRPVNSGIIKAVGQFVSEKDGVYYAESILYNQQGKKIAFGKGTFVKSKINLTKEIGYE